MKRIAVKLISPRDVDASKYIDNVSTTCYDFDNNERCKLFVFKINEEPRPDPELIVEQASKLLEKLGEKGIAICLAPNQSFEVYEVPLKDEAQETKFQQTLKNCREALKEMSVHRRPPELIREGPRAFVR